MKSSIGERITLSKKDKELIVKIKGTIEPWMNHALLGWLIMWSIMGGYVMYVVFSGQAANERFWFFITYLAFWLYFEVKALYSWLFRVYGYELIKINSTEMYLKKAVLGYGKVNRYDRENIKDLRKVEHNRKSISEGFNKSFWVMGNEQLIFDFFGKEVGLGMHLEEKDRSELLIELRRFLKKK